VEIAQEIGVGFAGQKPHEQADLLVVDGDPLAGITVLTERERIWLVLVAGRPVAGRALAPAPLSHRH